MAKIAFFYLLAVILSSTVMAREDRLDFQTAKNKFHTGHNISPIENFEHSSIPEHGQSMPANLKEFRSNVTAQLKMLENRLKRYFETDRSHLVTGKDKDWVGELGVVLMDAVGEMALLSGDEQSWPDDWCFYAVSGGGLLFFGWSAPLLLPPLIAFVEILNFLTCLANGETGCSRIPGDVLSLIEDAPHQLWQFVQFYLTTAKHLPEYAFECIRNL